MSKKRAIITGATGFIGKNLVAQLAADQWEVLCAVRKPVKAVLPGLTVQTLDLEQPSSIDKLFSTAGAVEALFHLGAALPTHQQGTLADADYIRVNAAGTASLLQAAIKAGVHSFVYASSISVIGKPTQVPVREDHPLLTSNPYSLSKLFGEQYCELIRKQSPVTRVTSLRITSPYGPGMPTQSVLPRFVAKVLANEEIQWMGEGSRSQNFVHIHDLVQLFIKAANVSEPGVYNAGAADSINMRKLAELIIRLTPGTTSRATASGRPDPQDDFRWEIDSARAKEKLGYSEILPFEQGLREYIESVRDSKEPASWWGPL